MTMGVSTTIIESLLDLLSIAVDDYNSHNGTAINSNHWTNDAKKYITLLTEPATKDNPVMYRLIRSPKEEIFTRAEFITLCNTLRSTALMQEKTGFTSHQLGVITTRLRAQGFRVKYFIPPIKEKKKSIPSQSEASMFTG